VLLKAERELYPMKYLLSEFDLPLEIVAAFFADVSSALKRWLFVLI
jgi:hypothetical protein